MSNLFLTLVIAFVIIVFAIALLAIGWLITGKTRIEKACGRDPTKKQDGSCHTCELCEHPEVPSPSSLDDKKNHPSSHS
jgi:hypothetical protein